VVIERASQRGDHLSLALKVDTKGAGVGSVHGDEASTPATRQDLAVAQGMIPMLGQNERIPGSDGCATGRANMRIIALTVLCFAATAFAQDAGRGQQLFNQTSRVKATPVASCTSCHADPETLRAMLANRGIALGDANAIRRLLQEAIAGALPGARGAKAQYQNVLNDQDLSDLAAYLARAQAATLPQRIARR
jgi:cytochrome c553